MSGYEEIKGARFMGFAVTELLALHSLLRGYDSTLSTVMDIARERFVAADKERNEREWREHFGILCDLFAEEVYDDTPYIMCATCRFKVVTEKHMLNATMRCTPKGHEVFFGREYFER